MDDKIEQRLIRIEDKLDAHLDRVSAVEVRVEQLRGFAKVSVTTFLTVIGFMGAVLWSYIFPHKQ